MRLRLPRRGEYIGRLAFNPDTGFHVDPEGRHVLTEDGGKTWRYARRADASHITRYHRQTLAFRATATEQAEKDLTDEQMLALHPHHFEQASAPTIPDGIAETATGHTAAWKEQT